MRHKFTAVALCAVTGFGCAVNAADSSDSLSAYRLLTIDGTAVQWVAQQPFAPAKITYAIATGNMKFERARNCAEVTAPQALLSASSVDLEQFRREARAAFDMWESAVNVKFIEIAEPWAAGIVIGAQLTPAGHAFANVDYNAGDNHRGAIERSIICLNPSKKWKIGFDGNLAVYDIRYTLAHEIGHAIGLDHPESGHQLMSFVYREQFRSLQPGDIAGAQQIYGARWQNSTAAIEVTSR